MNISRTYGQNGRAGGLMAERAAGTTATDKARILEVMLGLGLAYAVVAFYRDVSPGGDVLFLLTVPMWIANYVHLKRGSYLSVITGAILTSIVTIGILAVTYDRIRHISIYPVYEDPVASHALLAGAGATLAFQWIAVRWGSRMEWSAADALGERVARAVVWPVLALALALALMNFRGAFVTDKPGIGGQDNPFLTPGGQLAATMGVALTAVVAWRAYGRHRAMFLSVMALVLFELVVFSVLTGNRAATFGILAVLGMMAHAASKSPWRHWAAAGAFVAAIILLQVLAQFRSEAADSGIRRAAWESVTEAPKTLTIDDVRTIQMFPQSFWHLLHTVDLYDSGAGRGGESFANVVPQAMPGFIADWVGFKRPVNDAAVLAGFKQHGGGMFVIAQGYWNFGFLGAVGTGAGIGMLVVLFERRFRSREPLLGVGYLTMIVASVFGLVYGLQSYVRALEIALLLAVAAAVYHRYIERRVTAAMRSIRWTGRRDAVPALRPGQRQAIQG